MHKIIKTASLYQEILRRDKGNKNVFYKRLPTESDQSSISNGETESPNYSLVVALVP